MSLDNLNGDILLFFYISVPNRSGPFQIFSNFFDFLIKYGLTVNIIVGMVVQETQDFKYMEKNCVVFTYLNLIMRGFMDSENGE